MTSTGTRSTPVQPARRPHVFLVMAVGALVVLVGVVLFASPGGWLSDIGIGFAGLALSQAAIWLHAIAAPLRVRLAAFAAIAVVPWLCWIPSDGDVRENLRPAAAIFSLGALAVAFLAFQEHRRQRS